MSRGISKEIKFATPAAPPIDWFVLAQKDLTTRLVASTSLAFTMGPNSFYEHDSVFSQGDPYCQTQLWTSKLLLPWKGYLSHFGFRSVEHVEPSQRHHRDNFKSRVKDKDAKERQKGRRICAQECCRRYGPLLVKGFLD